MHEHKPRLFVSPLELEEGDVVLSAQYEPCTIVELHRAPVAPGRTSLLTTMTVEPLAPAPGSSPRPMTWGGRGPLHLVGLVCRGRERVGGRARTLGGGLTDVRVAFLAGAIAQGCNP